MNNTENDSRQLTKDETRSGKVSREEFHKIKRNPIYLVLDGLKCAHNVGKIIRLSDALLVEKVYRCSDCVLPPSRTVRKGSLGSERWVDWEHREDALDTVSELKEKGVSIIIEKSPAAPWIRLRYLAQVHPYAVLLNFSLRN